MDNIGVAAVPEFEVNNSAVKKHNYATSRDSFMCALFVLEDMPIGSTNEVLSRNEDEATGTCFWLAEHNNKLPDFTGMSVDVESAPIDENWRQHFVGATLEDLADYVRAVPRPPKWLC
ncbi:hypothetical protein DOTSEDRAFT_28201 [Dothistroma septosporum NZE10]|uniref:Uncharacterized protein n=1 Tax=Dothistroma septosporum (strain NZE10 / CBS 128990) TaxID=675120 RepID=N1PFF3_DOTSN|nr:hypothetical protein DOTSEDRAFT_28201 [Dothistroma septosporum NZE10]